MRTAERSGRLIGAASWPGNGEIDEDEYHARLEALRSQQYADTAYRG